MIDERWMEDATAYVLGSLDPEETRTFERRMAESAELREEVASLRETLAKGALAGTVDPPLALRDRVLREARAARPAMREDTSAALSRAETGSTITPLAAKRRRWAPWLLAAVLAAVSLGLGEAYRRERGERDELDRRLSEVTSQLGEVSATAARTDSILTDVLGADVATARLVATDAPPSARFFMNARAGRIVLAAYDLPPAPAGRSYQLWGIPEGGDPVSLGTFQSTADGRALHVVPVEAGVRFAIAAVTEEPAGGSPQPTTTPFLVGSVN